jgi:DNA uptake protein ComE-like DNA-binding protein
MKRIALSVVATVLALGIVSAVRADEPAGTATTPPPAAAAPAKSTSTHQTTTTTTTTTHSTHQTTTTTHHKSSGTHKLDLNSASKEQLMTLPGMDDATADKIIAGRPYKSTSELSSKSVLSKEEYKKVSAHVMVKKAA